MNFPSTEAHKRRVDARTRQLLVALHGLAPEPEVCDPGDRYAATAGEMLAWLRQDGRDAEADMVESARSAVLRPYYDRRLRGSR